MKYREAVIKATEIITDTLATSVVEVADALCQSYNAGRASALDGLETVANETLIREMRADQRRMDHIRTHANLYRQGFSVEAREDGDSIDERIDAAIEKEAGQP